MYAKQYEVGWGGHCFNPLFISMWNILKSRKGFKYKGPNDDIGEGGKWRVGTFAFSVSLVDAVFKNYLNKQDHIISMQNRCTYCKEFKDLDDFYNTGNYCIARSYFKVCADCR